MVLGKELMANGSHPLGRSVTFVQARPSSDDQICASYGFRCLATSRKPSSDAAISSSVVRVPVGPDWTLVQVEPSGDARITA
jgi:hypothetical protein